MARWEELCELLMDKALTPQEIVERLGVRPSRLKQMLESKRLAERLGLLEQIAARRSDHAVLLAVASAAEKLAALAAKDTETGRKACLDVLAQANVVRADRESAGKHHKLANWHKDYRKWERSEKRKARREGSSNTVPDGSVPPEASPYEPVAQAMDPVPDGAKALNGQPVAGGPGPAAPARDTDGGQREGRSNPPPRRSKGKLRELAGLRPEEESPEARAVRLGATLNPNLPAYGGDGGFIPRPGGRIVRHIIGGKVFLGST